MNLAEFEGRKGKRHIGTETTGSSTVQGWEVQTVEVPRLIH